VCFQRRSDIRTRGFKNRKEGLKRKEEGRRATEGKIRRRHRVFDVGGERKGSSPNPIGAKPNGRKGRCGGVPRNMKGE